ncbi:MBL fold metallo-hydrolase [candidate division KSB1 bacterium]
MVKKVFTVILALIASQLTLNAQDIRITQITDDVIVLHAGVLNDISVVREVGGNMTTIRTEEGLIVIESLTSSEAAKKARQLIKNHFPGLPFKYLINTHHHADHIRGNQYFRDAVIIAHINLEKHQENEYKSLVEKYGDHDKKIKEIENDLNKVKDSSDKVKKMKEDLKFWKEAKLFMEEYSPAPPELQISSDAVLKLGGKTFEIMYFGTAHTDNDIVILDKEDRVLIMGDLLFYRKCYIMNPASDVLNWMALLEKLIERNSEYDYVIPGHGSVKLKVDALHEQRGYLSDLYNAVKNAKQSDLSLEQATNKIRLEKYREYMDYDRIALDIEAAWKQIEKKGEK